MEGNKESNEDHLHQERDQEQQVEDEEEVVPREENRDELNTPDSVDVDVEASFNIRLTDLVNDICQYTKPRLVAASEDFPEQCVDIIKTFSEDFHQANETGRSVTDLLERFIVKNKWQRFELPKPDVNPSTSKCGTKRPANPTDQTHEHKKLKLSLMDCIFHYVIWRILKVNEGIEKKEMVDSIVMMKDLVGKVSRINPLVAKRVLKKLLAIVEEQIDEQLQDQCKFPQIDWEKIFADDKEKPSSSK